MERSRISELPNKITENIDAASPEGMLDMLKRSDDQMFEGWEDYPCVFSDCHVKTLARVADAAADMLQDNIKNGSKNAFIFSGCGTSGRIAWLCTRTFNQWLNNHGIPPCFYYLIAGGDPSLIRGEELPEDNPLQGMKDLLEMNRNKKHAMYFGITCGLSAPYVAGQLDYAMKQETITPVLVGFNPVSLARNVPIEIWERKTCREIFLRLEDEVKNDHAFVVNPVVGPESITGSTRMKGGSMTKILLETIFLTALNQLMITIPSISAYPVLHHMSNDETGCKTKRPRSLPGDAVMNGGPNAVIMHGGHDTTTCHSAVGSEAIVRSLLDFYHRATQAAYCSNRSSLASVMSKAGESLCKPDGHLYYIGLGSFGLIGLVDGSEMLTTFGASLDDVRGFVEGGWSTCNNQCGDISQRGQVFRISTEHFETDILPNLTSNDLVIFLGPEINSIHLLESLSKSSVQLARIATAGLDSQSPTPSKIPKSRYCAESVLKPTHWTSKDHFTLTHEAEELAVELGMKVAINAVSTGANVMTGRVYGNAMINVTVANNKLFYRSINIISQMSQRPVDVCRAALLSAIYSMDTVVDEVEERPISEHILTAMKVKMAVPKAILLASGRAKTADDAHRMLQSVTSIRLLVRKI